MANPRVADLRHRVDLETSAKAAVGGVGGTTLSQSYTSGAQVWARVDLIRGGRYQDGVQIDDAPTHRVTIRYRDDFEVWKYIREGSRRWRIVNAGDADGRREWVEFGCVEMTP